MKHVIVIETSDDVKTTTVIKAQFQKELTSIAEIYAEYYIGSAFVRSQFFQYSAIDAVKKMYNAS